MQLGLDLLRVGPRAQPDHAHVDGARRSTGEQAQEIRVTGNEVAVGGKAGPDLGRADDVDPPAVDLGRDGLAGRELGGDARELATRPDVEQASIRGVEPGRRLENALGDDRRGIRHDSVDEEWTFLTGPRVLPSDRACVQRGDGLDFGVPLSPRQVPPRERFGAVDLVGQRVEDDQLSPQPPVDVGRAIDRGAQEAELHPHQEVGENDPDDGRQQLRPPVAELEPGDGQLSKRAFHFGPPQTSITTSTLALESPATFGLSAGDKADAHLDDPGVDIGDRVVVEDNLAADDQVFP